MARLRGWAGHVRVEPKTVRSLARSDSASWVGWTGTDATVWGPHRANMECDKWSQLKVGDPIDVLYLPSEDGDGDKPYRRNGGSLRRNTAWPTA